MAEGASGGEMNSGNNSNLLIIDGAKIGCDIVIKTDDSDVRAIRKRLTEMSEADIKCPVSSSSICFKVSPIRSCRIRLRNTNSSNRLDTAGFEAMKTRI